MHAVPIVEMCFDYGCLLVDLQTEVHVVAFVGKYSDDDWYIATLRTGMRARCSGR